MTNAYPMEQETLEQVRPRDAESRAALENKLDQARSVADNANASSANAASDNQTLKNELPAKQYDAKSEASARLEEADKKLRFGKLDANSTYERNGYQYTTDAQGRVVNVRGKLDRQDGVRDKYEQRRVGHLGQEGDEGGHLIATRFNGSPEGVNLVPQDGNLNHGVWSEMEEKWAGALKSQDVQVEINVHYPDKNSFRPDSFIVKYKIGDGKDQNQFFKNQPGG
jgi:hypothetical protein